MTTTTKRQLKFGIEIETSTSRSRGEVIEALEKVGVPVKSARYSSETDFEFWKVQPDGSINGWEIVSPPQTDTVTLEKVIKVLRNDLKVRCTSKTGLHLHHDISDLPLEAIKNLYRLYAKYQKAISAIMTEKRRDNAYCRPISSYDLEKVESCESTEEFKRSFSTRYKTLNGQSYVKYGTIEFRQHHGTTHPNEILPWIELTHKMVERSMGPTVEMVEFSSSKEALDSLLVEVGLQTNKKLVTHYNWAYKTRNKVS